MKTDIKKGAWQFSARLLRVERHWLAQLLWQLQVQRQCDGDGKVKFRRCG